MVGGIRIGIEIRILALLRMAQVRLASLEGLFFFIHYYFSSNLKLSPPKSPPFPLTFHRDRICYVDWNRPLDSISLPIKLDFLIGEKTDCTVRRMVGGQIDRWR